MQHGISVFAFYEIHHESNELPLAASYVIDTDGVIRYAFLDVDYRNRAEPSDIVEVLNNLN